MQSVPFSVLREKSLASAARYRGRGDFCDPFCGSGTIAIEAALAALNRAPGMNRSFGAQKWACVPQEVWREARTEALDKEYRGDYRILGPAAGLRIKTCFMTGTISFIHRLRSTA